MGRRIASSLQFIHFAAALLLCSGGSIVKDITTPITTYPTTLTDPQSPTVMNPANPIMTPLATNTPVGSWCVARQSAPQTALQAALDYACSVADCSAIMLDGPCYSPNTVTNHASYAFNSYYQNNPIPSSCNFDGNAVAITTDPSYGTCQYASTSTSSSVLNISNSIGSRVFGAGRPVNPSTSAAALPIIVPYFHYVAIPLVIFHAVQRYNPNALEDFMV